MFPKNEGPLDRAIRIVAGVLLLPGGLFLLDGLDGAIGGLVVAAVGLMSLVTGATGRCIIYIPFGINTLPKKEERPVVHRVKHAA